MVTKGLHAGLFTENEEIILYNLQDNFLHVGLVYGHECAL